MCVAVSDACAKYRVNFTFDAIGALFVKDGRQYLVDRQDIQKVQAFKAGLNHFFGKPEYKLYDPYDGHLLGEDELWVPQYHAGKCFECPSLETCVGCTDCGNCKNVRLVDYEEIKRIQKM